MRKLFSAAIATSLATVSPALAQEQSPKAPVLVHETWDIKFRGVVSHRLPTSCPQLNGSATVESTSLPPHTVAIINNNKLSVPGMKVDTTVLHLLNQLNKAQKEQCRKQETTLSENAPQSMSVALYNRIAVSGVVQPTEKGCAINARVTLQITMYVDGVGQPFLPETSSPANVSIEHGKNPHTWIMTSQDGQKTTLDVGAIRRIGVTPAVRQACQFDGPK